MLVGARIPVVLLPVLVLASAASACRGESSTKKDDGKSVMQGGKARTAPGRTLEDAKKKIEGAEKQLGERSDDMLDKSAGENVGRGAP